MKKNDAILVLGAWCLVLGALAEPPPPPTGMESNGTPIKVTANYSAPAPASSFTMVTVTVRNKETKELVTLFGCRTEADSRFYKVEFMSDGSARLWERETLDQPFHLAMIAHSLGTNWVFNSFEAAEFRGAE